MCMGYGRDIKAWVCERDRQDANGMLEAWGQVLCEALDALPEGASYLPYVARAGQDDLQDVLINFEGETA